MYSARRGTDIWLINVNAQLVVSTGRARGLKRIARSPHFETPSVPLVSVIRVLAERDAGHSHSRQLLISAFALQTFRETRHDAAEGRLP